MEGQETDTDVEGGAGFCLVDQKTGVADYFVVGADSYGRMHPFYFE